MPAGDRTDAAGLRCARRDSNPYALRHTVLSRARLPFRHSRWDKPIIPESIDTVQG